MRALVLRGAGTLVAADVDTPAPRPGEVLVRVTHTGICGTDLKIFTGAMPAACPLIMGHEIAGEVVDGELAGRVLIDPVLYCGRCRDCTAGRTNLCSYGGVIGREVNGGFAEYVVAPRSHVYPLPDALESRVAPLIQVLTTCLHAQRRASVGQGQTVAVIGLGVSGQLHVQLAKARGAAHVTGITRSAWKRALAETLGADLTAPTGDEAVRAVRGATDDHGADVVTNDEETFTVGGSCAGLAFLNGHQLRDIIGGAFPDDLRSFCYPEEPSPCSEYTSLLRGRGQLRTGEDGYHCYLELTL